MRISDWSSDVCSSDLTGQVAARLGPTLEHRPARLNRSDATARRSTRLPFLRLADKDGQPLFRRSRSCLPVLKKGTCFSDTRSEEHTSELQSLMRISYAVFCLTKQNNITINIRDIISYYYTR